MAIAVKENKKVEIDTNKPITENKSNGTKVKLKKCFIITPIGAENSEIRRQIDGVIDACIIPALEDFDVTVSHRINSTGSISNQIINHIYEDDLVIANLTLLNPNVMYELAFRHAIRKPIIVIKNKNDGKQLPFDIKDDRTIFYTDDIKGSIELKEQIRGYLKEIDYKKQTDNPISRAIKDYKTRELFKEEAKTNGNSLDSTGYILKRLDEIDRKIDGSVSKPYRQEVTKAEIVYHALARRLNDLTSEISELSENDIKKLSQIDLQLSDIREEYEKIKEFISPYNKDKFLSTWIDARTNLAAKQGDTLIV